MVRVDEVLAWASLRACGSSPSLRESRTGRGIPSVGQTGTRDPGPGTRCGPEVGEVTLGVLAWPGPQPKSLSDTEE
ncbi:hypothetical protein NN561_008746 [Cricetulus griseus]